MEQSNLHSVSITELTTEQKKALLAELEAEQKAERDRIKNERANYKDMANEAVETCFPVLKTISEDISNAKEFVFDTLNTLTKIKAELYDREDGQNTHTFSTKDGSKSITIGFNMSDGWDDTADTGIAKVKDYLQTLVKDESSKNLVDTVMKLLSKDSKGNLKASRVLELKQLADKTGDAGFIDAIQIIQDAYKPVRSKEFVRCEYKGDRGETIKMPLSITEAPFPDKDKEPVDGAFTD